MVFVSVGLAYAESEKFEAEARYWFTDLESKASVTSSGVTGTDIDLKDDLGIGDENLLEARLAWNTGPNSKIKFAYTQVGYSGSKNVDKTITFEGKTYTVGTNVESDLDIQYLRLGWAWQFINLAEGKVKLGTLLDVKALMLEASLDAPSLGFSESADFAGALPTVGLVLDLNPIEKVNLFAEVSGLTAGDYGYFIDTEFGIKLTPMKNFSFSAGYRIFDMKFENDPDYAELTISGPFIGGTLKF
jgi:hypothetical protein